jgi:cobalt-zinc-cadmium efflux system outer membrane protein
MNIAELKQAAHILALRTEVKRRFLQVYVLQEQLKLEQDTVKLVQALADAVAKRVAAGEASPLDEAKVAVELASSRIGVGRARRELDAARYSLASSWDGNSPKFSEVRANYPTVMEVPPENELLALIEFNPNYRILEQEVAQASAVLDLTRAEAWSDIEIGGGIQRFNETDDHAFFLEVSIPIPLFDRNQGGIQEAKHTQNRAAKELAAGLLELKTTLIETSGRLRSAQEAFFTMQNTVMPAAEEAFLAVQKAYQVGEQDYLELVEAQRTQLESQRELLELFAEVQELRAELDALISEKLQ